MSKISIGSSQGFTKSMNSRRIKSKSTDDLLKQHHSIEFGFDIHKIFWEITDSKFDIQ